MKIAERFWSKVAVGEGCWEWQGWKDEKGYGMFDVEHRNGQGRKGWKVAAHRVAYQLAIGPIADEMTIDHVCRNKSCVNPWHLDVCTRAENMYRAPWWQEHLMRKAEGPYSLWPRE